MIRSLAMTLLLLLASVFVFQGCGSSTPNRQPLNEVFPSVEGTALSGENWRLPEDLQGKHAVLLLGYKQNSQFDIDRWLMGLTMMNVSTPVLEVPTIKDLVPGLISGTINQGMRNGIPEPVWEAVVTVYGDAGKLVDLTGNENPNNARVLILDPEGTIVWFHDLGFSAPDLKALLKVLPENEVGGPDWG